MATALAVRNKMIDVSLDTEQRYQEKNAKRLYYLSMEFLMGRSLVNNLMNLEVYDECVATLKDMGADIEELKNHEPDAALGNGGLGRLAACFLDSLATQGMPGYGYGINYEYGLFRQEIENGYQQEKPDNWLAFATPWELDRRSEACVVPVYGHVEHTIDRKGNYNPMWLNWRPLVGVPFDMPIVGYGGRTVNFLRLFTARSSHDFDMAVFNDGDYHAAVNQKIQSETISKVLYPSDLAAAGKELRLVQEYFLVACALRDIVRRYHDVNPTFDDFPNQVAIQLNDTHPALTVVELMRMLVDEQELEWDNAWAITQATLGYTNHTLMGEALERWSVPLFEYVLPRHLQIVYEINRRFLEQVANRWPGDAGRLSRMSIIEEGSDKKVRMANLAIVGSHSVNGVSALHTELIKHSLVPDFYEFWPQKFNNKTNGVTPRRWLLKANPDLSGLISRAIGNKWVTNLDELRHLEPLADDASFQEEFAKVKLANKLRLAKTITQQQGIVVDPNSLFDCQVKRIHEYKRQLLNVLHIIHEYLALVEDGTIPVVPRTYLFAGKAAPGYWAAKQIIKLINNVAKIVNSDPRTLDLIKVVFIRDYRVSVAENTIPAANISEQISTAGTEASGTSNMKFTINGALTMGTLDGANVEICEEVGNENIYIFGLRAPQVQELFAHNNYRPWEYAGDPQVHRVIESIANDRFSPKEHGLFKWIAELLLSGNDRYVHLADFPSFLNMQKLAGSEFVQPSIWNKKAILNVARSGKFSSDRTIREYADDIWGIKSI
jgi:starch phosphorylase